MGVIAVVVINSSYMLLKVSATFHSPFFLPAENKDDVLKGLMDLVMDVEPQLHKNQKHFL